MTELPTVRPLFLYLSGPITAAHGFSVEENVASAVVVFLDCCRHGVPAFCPHLSAVYPAAFTIHYDLWMAIDFAVIDRCTHVLTLPRWETSPGAQREVSYAQDRGIPVIASLAEVA